MTCPQMTWQDILGITQPVRARFQHPSLKHKGETPAVHAFLGERGVNCCIFTMNKWTLGLVWGLNSFSLHVFTLFSFLCFFFLSLSFSPDTQALQCMLISLQAELDIQRYLMKIESSQRVSTPPFLFSALSCTSPPALLLSRMWPPNQPLNRAPVLSPSELV